jgi:hypothetical protein
MTNDATYRCAGARTQNAATQNVAGNTADHGARGGTLLLVSHTGATGQTSDGYQQNGWQAGGKAFGQIHGKFLQLRDESRW